MENLHLKNLKTDTINQMKLKQNALELQNINETFQKKHFRYTRYNHTNKVQTPSYRRLF